MKILHLFIYFISIPLFLFIIFVFLSKNNSKDNTTAKNISNVKGAQEINITKHFSNASKSVTIEAQWLGTKNKDIKLVDVSVFKDLTVKKVKILFKEKDKTVATITADKGVLLIPAKEPDKISAVFDNVIELSGNVKTVTYDKKSLFCDKLTVEPEKNILKAKGNCVFNSNGKRKKGSSCTSDILLENITIKRKINNFMNIFK